MKHDKKPQLYEGIRLRVQESPEPRQFNLAPISGENFAKLVERLGGAGVIDEEFDPNVGPLLIFPSDVKLRDGAKFILITGDTSKLPQQFQSLQAWHGNYISGCERQLGDALRKHAVALGHSDSDVEIVYNMKVVGPEGDFRELDAVAFARGCAFVGEYKNVMDVKGAEQLKSTMEFIELRRDLVPDPPTGNVGRFKDRQIYGILAGRGETTDPMNKKVMDKLLNAGHILKWFEGVDFGPDAIKPSQASPLPLCLHCLAELGR